MWRIIDEYWWGEYKTITWVAEVQGSQALRTQTFHQGRLIAESMVAYQVT